MIRTEPFVKLGRLPRLLLLTLIKSYRLLLKPSLGNACRFEPSCSAYAMQAIEQHGAAAGAYLAGKRLLRCHPWCDGGLDPVPERVGKQAIRATRLKIRP
jgi:uncharacterized protein